MSIFSGWDAERISELGTVVRTHPAALALLAGMMLVGFIVVGFAVSMLTHHIGDFYAHVQEEEERAQKEEKEENQKKEGEKTT